MEAVEVVVVAAPPCHNITNNLSPVAKRKRTKRHRLHSLIPFSVSSHRLNPGSFTEDSTTTEEEDTARCLILLAQGHFLPLQTSKPVNRQPETADRGGGMYACKTCNRAFSSFQALGGHRTSHKKPKNEKKPLMFSNVDEDYPSPSKKRTPLPSLSLQLSSTASAAGKQFPSPRIHECSHCGAEFTSGQALGGHMRRHRAGPTSPLPNLAAAAAYITEPVPKKPRNGLSLDLNFPAPDDENHRRGFDEGQQRGPEKFMKLPTTPPALVDCHF